MPITFLWKTREKKKFHEKRKSLTKKEKASQQNKENKLKTTGINKTISTVLFLCEWFFVAFTNFFNYFKTISKIM